MWFLNCSGLVNKMHSQPLLLNWIWNLLSNVHWDGALFKRISFLFQQCLFFSTEYTFSLYYILSPLASIPVRSSPVNLIGIVLGKECRLTFRIQELEDLAVDVRRTTYKCELWPG